MVGLLGAVVGGAMRGSGSVILENGRAKREAVFKMLEESQRQDNRLELADRNNAFTAQQNQLTRQHQRDLASSKPPSAPTIKTFYDADGREYKGQWNPQTKEWDKIGGSKATNNVGLEMELPDGTIVRQGPMGKQDEKNIANRVNTAQEIAASGTNLKQMTGMLRKANENSGYTGPGGEFVGAVDDAMEAVGIGILPGDSRSRATMRSGGLQIALENVSKTKGAISNAEMALFMAAAPGLQNTREGNAALLDMIDAIADRQVERATQMEQWRSERGNLNGFEKKWNSYVNANPLIVDDKSGSVKLQQRDTSSTQRVVIDGYTIKRID